MIKIRVDKKASFLPIKLSRGTTPQRLESSIELNSKILKSLKYDFVDRKIKPATLKKTIKSVIGKNINLKIHAVDNPKEANLTHYVNSSKVNKGYILNLPQNSWDNMIEQSHLGVVMKQVQKLCNKLYNPKFTVRELKLFKNESIMEETGKFFADNVTEKQVLKTKKLDKFLKGKTPNEQIDVLQVMRYNVLTEKNNHVAEPIIDRQIAKLENMHIQGKNYDLSEYKFDEKMQILNKKLAQVIQDERTKNANDIQVKQAKRSKIQK